MMKPRSSIRSLPPALLLLLAAASCSGDDPAPTPTGPADPGTFTLAASPASVILLPGESGEVAVSVIRTGGFSGAVTVSAEGLPDGVSAPTATVAEGAGSSVLHLSAAGDAPPAEARLTLRGSTSVTGVADRTATVTLVVTALNPAPILARVLPDETIAGSPDLTLTVLGEGFIPDAEVRWNGEARPTTFVSATELAVEIPATDIANPDTAQVTVVHPAPGGGTSAPLPLIVRPAPARYAWTGTATQTVAWNSPADGSAHLLTVRATGVRFEGVDAGDDLPEGVLRYEMVAGEVTVAFEKNRTFGCGAASAGPLDGSLHTGFLDVLTDVDEDDAPRTRYRGAGTMEPVTLELSMNCGTGGMANFDITAPEDGWLRTMEDPAAPAWQETDVPEVLEGSHSTRMTFEGEFATWTWRWRFERVDLPPDA